MDANVFHRWLALPVVVVVGAVIGTMIAGNLRQPPARHAQENAQLVPSDLARLPAAPPGRMVYDATKGQVLRNPY